MQNRRILNSYIFQKNNKTTLLSNSVLQLSFQIKFREIETTYIGNSYMTYSALRFQISKFKVGTTGNPIGQSPNFPSKHGQICLESCVNAQALRIFFTKNCRNLRFSGPKWTLVQLVFVLFSLDYGRSAESSPAEQQLRLP